MPEKAVAFVLAGGHVGGYGVLSMNRAKAAMPFAGVYRIVDFAISNLRNTHVEKIGIVIQYLPKSLIEHVGVGHSWDLFGHGRHSLANTGLGLRPVGPTHPGQARCLASCVLRDGRQLIGRHVEFVLRCIGDHQIVALDSGNRSRGESLEPADSVPEVHHIVAFREISIACSVVDLAPRLHPPVSPAASRDRLLAENGHT